MVASTALCRGNGNGRIAGWFALLGLSAALGVAALTGRIVLDERAGDATELGALGFTVTFAAPFVAALASLLVHDIEVRRAAWLAAGVLAVVLAVLTVFSGIGWLFGVAGAGLLLAWWVSKGRGGSFGSVWNVALAGWLIVWFGGALWALWSRETPVCWNGAAIGAGWVTAATPNECTSDIFDDMEGVLALGAVAIGLGGAALLRRANRGRL